MKFNLDSAKVETIAGESDPLVFAKAKSAEENPLVELMFRHGALYAIFDDGFAESLIKRVERSHPALMDVAVAAIPYLVAQAKTMFKHLADQLTGGNRPYVINSSLISHLTFPGDGRTFSKLGDLNDNERVPAFMTFVGQFLDHDLTLNPANLFDFPSDPLPDPDTILNDASAIIDLDSIYARTSALSHGTDADILNPDFTFKLTQLGPNAYDLTRDNTPGMFFKKAFMHDLRNDENQMILQIHILLIRVHNKLMAELSKPPSGQEQTAPPSPEQLYEIVRLEVIRNWQSFVLNEYLPTVVSAEPLDWVLGEIVKPGFGALQHKPEADGSVKMPHEFSIGFRMGHTQLRDAYKVQPNGNPIPLFNNRTAEPIDLRGSRDLELTHVIDWPFFSASTVLSNKIDSKVTSVVFDLPESAIPDKVLEVGNLPQRNLIRSSKVDLAAAEDLIELYGLTQKLTPKQIEPDAEKSKLFQLDETGMYKPTNPFRTSLWYYVIKEPEFFTCSGQLGPLGGRIIAEVIAGGIYYYPDAFVHDPAWASKITGNRNVTFADLVNYVTV